MTRHPMTAGRTLAPWPIRTCLALTLPACAHATGHPQAGAVAPERIGAAWVADTGYVRAFALDAGPAAGVVLVDAGSEGDAAAIRRVLAAMGRSPEAVSTVLLTHAHLDHMAGLSAFPSAKVMALADEVPLAHGEVEARSPFGRSPLGWFFRVGKGLRVSRSLHDDETLAIGNLTIHVFALPGHTDGSAAYACGDLVFLGDAAYGAGPDRLEGPRWVFSHDIPQGEASLAGLAERLEDLSPAPTWLVPSHTPPVAGLGPLARWAGQWRASRR